MPRFIGAVTTLKTLQLSHNALSGEIPSGMFAVSTNAVWWFDLTSFACSVWRHARPCDFGFELEPGGCAL